MSVEVDNLRKSNLILVILRKSENTNKQCKHF